MNISNHFSLDQLVSMVQRLVNEGMQMNKAIILVAHSYAVDEMRLYQYIVSSK